MNSRIIYLTGFMATGKTTLGKVLADKLGWDFVDLDKAVEEHAEATISSLIEHSGEDAFRRIEAEILRSTALKERTVVACGGGTPCFFDNMEFMNLHGTTVWLIATPERIAERIEEAGDTRPLVAGMSRPELLDYIGRKLRERQPFYSKARLRFSGEHLETLEEIEQAADKLSEEEYIARLK